MSDVSELILVVEDEPPVRQLIAAYLKGAGYSVLEARDGQEAFIVFQKHADTIDLVLTDLHLPYLKGELLIREMRRRRPELKIVAISGYDEPPPDGTPFLPKPFTPDEIVTAVGEALEALVTRPATPETARVAQM